MTSYFFPPEFVNDLRARIDIVELIRDYVALTQAGVNFKGLCPFHSEKTPSFTVHQGKGIFHCFGCGVGGDAIAFLKRIENLSYPETLVRLATRAGIDISVYEQRRGSAEEQARARSEREKLSQAVAAAHAFFVRQLHDNLSGKAGHYLAKRGITPAQAKNFGLGFAPDTWSGLKDELRRRKVAEAVAVRAGLLVLKEGGGHCYDRFRDRLIFPIRDVSGQVIGFGGRSLGEAEPKYLNSPESPLFNKRRLLYDLHHARSAIAMQGMAFLVEGYMDALSLYLRGIDNVVATLGTALSEENVAAVKRYTSRVAVFFDNDKAGRAAAFRALPLFMGVGVMPEIVLLPEGVKDPDQLARGLDRPGLIRALACRNSLFDLYLEERGAVLNAYNDRLQFLTQVLEMIMRLPDDSLRGMALRSVAEKLRIAEEIVLDEYRRIRQRRPFPGADQFGAAARFPGESAEAGQRASSLSVVIPKTAVSPEEIILAALLRYPQLRREVAGEYLEIVENPSCLRFFEVLAGYEDDCENVDWLGRLSAAGEDDDELGSLYARLVHLPVQAEDVEIARKVVGDCLYSLRRRLARDTGRSLDRELLGCRDEERMFALLRRKMELKKACWEQASKV
ncbi:MAG: DNA primase [Deltaproteobacteria bacterium]|nr:DNA primase [Deltaproteobacteria bacterium]